MRNIHTIVFDLGNVLVRVDPARGKFGQLVRSFGLTPEEAFGRFSFESEVRRFMTGELAPEEFHRALSERFGLDFAYDRFVESWCDMFEPVEGMRELFEEISQRYEVGILSDTDPLHWNCIRKMMPWLERVAKPSLSFEVGFLKPHPGMFEAAAANAGREKHECLFIDDLVANVDGARYFGMPALLFTGEGKLRRDLTGLKLL